MGDLSKEMLVPRANGDNFMFGFNDEKLSDRVLHIEITSEHSLPPKSKNPKRLKSQARSIDSGIEVKSLHINSLILAAKSPFFYKLFTNGMMESQGKDVTLRIYSSEKVAFMDLLNYMYGSTLSASTSSELLNVLMVADKFEVSCCMQYCVELLLKITMSLESALLYLELPSTILVAEVVQPLIDASKQYIVARYEDFDNCKDEAMELPLNAIELVLGYEGLRVYSEDDIYDFIKEWARAHYPKQAERRKVITNRLMQYICFRYMTCRKLYEARDCPDDFDHEQVTNLIMDALLDKADLVPYGQHLQSSKDLTTTKSLFRGRVYGARLIKVVYIEFSSPSCVVYFDLEKQECENLPSSKTVLSELFILDGRIFYLGVTCSKKQNGSFCVLLLMDGCSETCTCNWEIAARMKSSKKFETYSEDSNCTLKEMDGSWFRDLLNIPWSTFISDDSDYFIDGIVHLRVDLTIVGSQA